MSQKPENAFISGVNRHLKDVYSEKMSNPWRAGTADVWYSGDRGDLWIEYKYVEKIPKSLEIRPALTPRQRKWLNDRHGEGREVAVILGCPDGGVIYIHGAWNKPLNTEEFCSRISSRKGIAQWIRSITGVSKCRSSDSPPG